MKLAGELWATEDIAAFLDAVAEGERIDQAVAVLGPTVTATQVRRVAKRDPMFREAYEVAKREHKAAYARELRSAARDRKDTSDRILEVELATHVPEYGHLRRDRVRHEGHVTHGIVIQADLDSLPRETLERLRAVLIEAGGEIIEGEAQEITELAS